LRRRRHEKCTKATINISQLRREGGVYLNPPLCVSHRGGLQLDIGVSPCGRVFVLPPRQFGVSRNAVPWRRANASQSM
jgi:hypothetical protein